MSRSTTRADSWRWSTLFPTRRVVYLWTRSLAVVAERQCECAMLHIIEYFATSLNVIQGHSKWHPWVGLVLSQYFFVIMYLVPFLRYSAWNNGVTLKCGLEITPDNIEKGTVRKLTCVSYSHFNCDRILYHFRAIAVDTGRKSRVFSYLWIRRLR